jgi:hypothetical protein
MTDTFTANIKQEQFNYNEWRRDNLFKDMTLEEIMTVAAKNDPIGKSFGLGENNG